MLEPEVTKTEEETIVSIPNEEIGVEDEDDEEWLRNVLDEKLQPLFEQVANLSNLPNSLMEKISELESKLENLSVIRTTMETLASQNQTLMETQTAMNLSILNMLPKKTESETETETTQENTTPTNSTETEVLENVEVEKPEVKQEPEKAGFRRRTL